MEEETALFDKYKPDFEDTRLRWQAFWNKEIIDRPCTRIVTPKTGADLYVYPASISFQHPDDDLDYILRTHDEYLSSLFLGGEAVPEFYPNFGPDLYAAFFGADLVFRRQEGTSWVKPFVTDWKTDAADLEHPRGPWWEAALKISRAAHEYGGDNWVVGVFDLHSNMDCLSAARGPQDLMVDMMDCPDDVEAALNSVRRSYAPTFTKLYEAAGQDKTGCMSWLPYYCEGKFAMIQCDFICMISPAMSRRFVIPALEEEAQFLDHCCYHLDGPDALVHLDDLLAIDRIDAIQWVPGSGAPEIIEWMDVLKKIQSAGKSLYIGASPEEVRIFHKELRPDLVFYDVYAPTQQAAEETLDWLKTNT